jgi:hypothetical protein
MGKGSEICDRQGVSLDVTDGVKMESELPNEINTILQLRRVGHRWFTKDGQVTFQRRKEGWIVGAYSEHIWKAFAEYGIIGHQAGTGNYELTHFSSLKAARQAVSDVSLEAGLNIHSRLTRGDFVSYKIKDLPLHIRREEGHWRARRDSLDLSQSLEKYFNSVEEFLVAWESTDIRLVHHPTRKAAHQAVINWLSQTIKK